MKAPPPAAGRPAARAAGAELPEAIRSLRRFLTRAAALSVVINLLVLAPTLYMLEVYGRVVTARSSGTLLMLTLLVVGAFAVMECLDWVRGRLLDAAAVELDRDLAERVFNASFEARLRSLPVGLSPQHDLRAIRGLLTSPAFTAILDAPMALLFIGIIFALSPLLGAFVAAAAVAMLAVGYATERGTRPPLDDAQRLAGDAQRYAVATLRNAQVIQAMGMHDAIGSRWLARQRRFLLRQAEASDHAGDGAALAKFIQVTQGSLVLGFACLLTLLGEPQLGGGTMIVAWMLSSRALAPLQQVITQWKTIVGARAAYDRLGKFLAALVVRAPRMPLPPPQGALTVEAVVATAPGSPLAILRGVSFAVPPGQVLAVVGPTAAGKSTLARVLVGLWPPASGKVRLDGVDVGGWDKQELGPHVGYVAQDGALFDGTVAENIARFRDGDRGKAEAAAQAIGLHEAIMALPDGYDTAIGGDGQVLSGGQRQRLALARAFYGEPRFIVLDEPNASLDEAGERALVQALARQKARGATIVIITHRASVLAVVDRMLVLRDGAVEMFGPRDDVLQALKVRAQPAPAPALPVPAAT